MKKAKLRGMARKMTDKKEFIVNDKSLAVFLKSYDVRLIGMKNGKFVFEYDDSIEDKLELFEKMQTMCMF